MSRVDNGLGADFELVQNLGPQQQQTPVGTVSGGELQHVSFRRGGQFQQDQLPDKAPDGHLSGLNVRSRSIVFKVHTQEMRQGWRWFRVVHRNPLWFGPGACRT